MRRRAMHPLSRYVYLFLVCISLIVLIGPDANGQASYTATILIQGLPSDVSTIVYVDGTANTTLRGGETRSFNFTSNGAMHWISVVAFVPNSAGLNGTRYYVKDTSWSFSGGGNHIFIYTPQYYLTVRTSYSSVTGEGWYNSGSVVQAVLKDSEIDEAQGTRHVFAGWTGDAGGTSLASNNIFMDGPKNATAAWKMQFYLTVVSDPPNVTNLTGAGWYDAGAQASISAGVVIPANENTRLRFGRWSGAYDGQSAAGSVLMDRPKTVEAHYVAQYLLTVRYEPANISPSYNETHLGWYDADSIVQLGPAPATIDLSSVERLRFVGWIDNGSLGSNVSITVSMNAPRKVTLSYGTQYYVDVRSLYGSSSGSGWYDRGSVAKISAATTSGTWPISYSLTDWKVDPSSGSLTKTDDSWTLNVDRPYIVEAVWSVGYLPLVGLIGGGAVAVAGLAVIVVVARRRGVSGRGRPIIGPPKPGSVPPSLGPTLICSSCGNRMPGNAVFCERCGVPVGAIPTASLEEKVYDYIVKHEGVISLSKASADLGISVQQLKELTEKLKKEGRLA